MRKPSIYQIVSALFSAFSESVWVQHPAGEHFYRHCQLMLHEIETFSDHLKEQRDLPEGRIRVYAPAEFFSFLIDELTIKFTERYPKLRV